jgi:hypothetical protein
MLSTRIMHNSRMGPVHFMATLWTIYISKLALDRVWVEKDIWTMMVRWPMKCGLIVFGSMGWMMVCNQVRRQDRYASQESGNSNGATWCTVGDFGGTYHFSICCVPSLLERMCPAICEVRGLLEPGDGQETSINIMIVFHLFFSASNRKLV